MTWQSVYSAIITFGIQIVAALVTLVIGLIVIGWITRFTERRLTKTKVEKSLHAFLISLIGTLLKILLIISIASFLGFEMSVFIAVLAAASFAIGLAFQGSLANFAGGVLILLLRPFKVGDFIEAVGYMGTVHEVQIFHTLLNTADNRRIIIPNGNLANTSVVNFSFNPTRRMDFKFGVGYGDDIDRVKAILMEIIENYEEVMEEPAPQVLLGEHGDSAIVFFVRAWCKREDYWTVYFDALEQVKRRFDQEGISIPYPQMDVHVNPGADE